jgi:hypothetical protein
MRKAGYLCFAIVVAVAAGGCASMDKSNRQRQVASMLSYLYPGSEQAPAAS